MRPIELTLDRRARDVEVPPKKWGPCLLRMGYTGYTDYNGNAAIENPGTLRVTRTWPGLSLSRSSAGLLA